MNLNQITLIGLGKLGLPLLTIFANNQQKIIGIDTDINKIKKLQNKEVPFFEPDLEKYLNNSFSNVIFSNKIDDAVQNTDIAIILVNTPSNKDGSFSNKYIYQAIDKISKNLKKSKKQDFLFIISSTVMPQSLNKIINRIEKKSNRKLNNGFGIAYVPDLVALGSVIKDFENPDVLILGESNSRYGDIVEQIYKKIIKNNAPIVRMSLIESEITKISLNAYITMKISFANFIGNISEKLNCSHTNITKALGYDKRISPYYIKSGTAFGGTCFPRDTWAFIKLCKKIGLNALQIKATQKINQNQNKILFDKVSIYKDKKIGIFGLSFKPNTTVTVESPGNILYNKLKEKNYSVVYFDPLIPSSCSLNDFIKNSDIIVLTHPDKKIINNFDLKNKIIINPWN